MYTFSKFFCVGVLNTALDFVVLNILVFFFGTGVHGSLFAVFKSVSFLAAVTSSYFLNRVWVFKCTAPTSMKEPVLFFAISCVGFLINVLVSFVAFSLFVRHVSPFLAANAGALMGTFVVLTWNFIGYRFFVFKQSHE